VDGTKEVVQPGENGLLVEPGNISALAAALVKLGGDPELRNVLRQKAQDTIRRQFNAADMTREIENVYSRVIE
jgi:glycosyltransferase involved in cell wall biosynthesis